MGLLHWGCDPFLPLEILALTKMSLMYLSFLNVTTMDIHSCTDAGTHSNPGVGDKMMGECNIQTGPHRDSHVCMKLCKEDGADIELGVHVYMY